MVEPMAVDTAFFVFNSKGVKRFRQEEQGGMEIFERKRRSQSENMSFLRDEFSTHEEFLLSTNIVTDPPDIAKLLEFTVDFKKKEILTLTNEIKSAINLKQLEEIQKHTKDLAEMVSTDPRLIHQLDHDLLNHIVRFLEYTENPQIQSQAIIILQTYIAYKINNQWIIVSIKASILVNLICCEDCQVKVQAMWLLRTMALTIPKPQFNETLEVALEPLTLLIDGSTDDDVIYGVSQTLAVVCQLYPMLPSAQFKMVYDSLLKLFNYKSTEIPPHVCLGLLYLCDGREEMVIEKKDFEPLIDRLIEIIKFYNYPDLCVNAIAALTTLGTIVRWGSDDDIEVILMKDALQILGHVLHFEHRDFVENACWIISNITAGKENHIIAVIDSGLIERLCGVVENYKLLDVKKEAAWAISNAIHGVGPGRIEDLRSRCVEPFWSILKVFRADQEIVSFCLEGLVILKGVKVSCNGQPIDAAGFKELLVRLRGAQFQSADDTKGLARWKKPRYADNIKSSYDELDIILHITCTFKEDMQQADSQICLVYKSLEEGTQYASRDCSILANEMEVYEPDSIWCI